MFYLLCWTQVGKECFMEQGVQNIEWEKLYCQNVQLLAIEKDKDNVL